MLYTTYLYVSVLFAMTVASLKCPQNCVCKQNDVFCNHYSSLSEIPTDMGEQLRRLEIKDASIRRISSLAMYPRLEELVITKCDLQKVEDGAFERNSRLKKIDLGENKLSLLNGRSLRGLSQGLSVLLLRQNHIRNVSDAFRGLRELRKLSLSDNRLTSIGESTFRDLSNLEHLEVSSNKLKQVNKKAFVTLKNLQFLALGTNPGIHLELVDFRKTQITFADIGHCDLDVIPALLPNTVNYIILSHNNISSLNEKTMAPLYRLSYFIADENMLTSIDYTVFRRNKQLEHVWLQDNLLTSVPMFYSSKLSHLQLSNNRIVKIMKQNFGEQYSSSLQDLQLEGNRISYIEDRAFRNLNDLKELNLADNKLAALDSLLFGNLGQLKTLRLSANPLIYFYANCFSGLVKLEALHLDYIRDMTAIFWDEMQQLPLKELYLAGSTSLVEKVVSISSKQTATLPALQLPQRRLTVLDLTDSGVSTTSSAFVEYLVRFPPKSLRFTSDRWYCDKRIAGFADWLRDTRTKWNPPYENNDDRTYNKNNGLRCLEPSAYAGQKIVTLRNMPDNTIAIPTRRKLPSLAPLTTGKSTLTTTRANGQSEPVRTPDPVNRGHVEVVPLTTKRTAVAAVEDADDLQSRHKFAALVLISATLLVLVIIMIAVVIYCFMKRRKTTKYSAANDGRRRSSSNRNSANKSTLYFTSGQDDNDAVDAHACDVIAGAAALAAEESETIALQTTVNLPDCVRTTELQQGGHTLSRPIATSTPFPAVSDTSEVSSGYMSLRSGRDANHEGPLRVYNWQEF